VGLKSKKMSIIRRASRDDLEGITEIYNDAVLKTVATFDTEPKTREEQEIWFAEHGPRYPILVAERDGLILGWASLSRWSERCAYSDTAEVSLYVSEKQRGRGIGRDLLDAIIRESREKKIHTIIARIAEGNWVSINLLESTGFEHIGVMREVGRKFDKLLDVYLMQKIFHAHSD
jgi:L-amino acid N-acyltransferase YncA